MATQGKPRELAAIAGTLGPPAVRISLPPDGLALALVENFTHVPG